MYEFKGTPGPWHVEHNPRKSSRISVFTDNNAIEISHTMYDEQALHDMTLQAAAPELLEAAIGMNNALQDFWDCSIKDAVDKGVAYRENIERYQDKLKQAIEKALNINK